MGLSGISHWLIVLLIVVLVFGTKKLRNIGKDLGGAVHDFKKGLNEGSEEADARPVEKQAEADKDDKPKPCSTSVSARCC